MKSPVLRVCGIMLAAAMILATTVAAQTACKVVYTISPQNNTAFGAAITIQNTGTTGWSSWSLSWAFANGQTVSSLWNGNETQSGANVTVTNESYNGSVAAGGSVTGIGFNGTWNGVTNAVPASFAVNGTTCGGSVTGSFSLAPASATVALAQGASTTDAITVTDLNGFTGAVTLAATSTNTGVTATVNGDVITLTASATATGSATITVTGSSGTLKATTTITVNVSGGSCVPTAITPYLQVNGAAWQKVANASVPAAATVNLGPQPTTGTWSWTGPNGYTAATRQINAIPLTAGANVYTATYSNTATCKSMETFTITEAGGPGGFTLTPAAATVTLAPGASTTDVITVTDTGGFTGAVTLAAASTNAGVTATVSGDVVTLTASATATGTATITVTGTSGTLTPVMTKITVAVSSTGGFTITPAAVNVSVAQGSSATLTITVTDLSPFNGAVSLSAPNWSPVPAGITVSGCSNPINGNGSCVLTLAASATTPTGTYVFTITGTSGTFIATSTYTLTVTGGFSVSSSCGGGLTLQQGSSTTCPLTITGATGTVTLIATSSNTGVTVTVNGDTLTIAASSTATGTATITVTVTSVPTSKSITIPVTITTSGTGSFTLAPTASTMTINLNSGSTDTINVTDVGGFNGPVTLTASGMPSGVTASWSVNPTTNSSVLSLIATSSATTGKATITIQGTSTGTSFGTLLATTSIALNVTSTPDVQIAWVSPAAGIAGSTFTVMPGTGTSFAETQGSSAIYFGTTEATVTTWAIDSIAVTVPSLAAGTYNVTAVVGGVTSNAVPFTITSATPSPEQYTGNGTWFTALGGPYGGCGVPQENIDSQNFVALNVQNDPGNYTLTLSRPISPTGEYASDIGLWNNGLNCGRWVHITMGDNCNGTNDGNEYLSFCRGGLGWVADQFTGAELDLVVADSCQDENAWCRDDPYHLDQAQAALNNYTINGAPAGDIYPNYWNNRQINWYFEPAPNYTGDINIGFLNGANAYWSAISITHLPNGIHGVQYLLNGVWTTAVMDADLGDDYIVLPTVAGGTQYEIQVFDVTNTLINNGRIYSFSYPASCGSSCTPALTPVTYTTSQ